MRDIKPAYDNSWFKEMVVYQIWCRSFKDGDNDGIGDLKGVLEKLDYIKSLGVSAIWFSPIYPSPQADFGYDISDYKNINPEYGDLELFKEILKQAHKRDIKIIMDLVVNHSSDECEWFKESKKGKENPYFDYYFWRNGKKNKKGELIPPNNWLSLFEGGAWEYDEKLKKYYLHVFSKKQPDLNHDNPKLREEIKDIMRFWLDMGVDGFREDVITFISKDENLKNGIPLPVGTGLEHYNKGPNLEEYLTEYRKAVIENYNAVMIAESPLTSAKDAIKYTSGNDRLFDMLISFSHLEADCFMTDTIKLPFRLRKMKRAFSDIQKNLQGKAWNSLYLENHDHPRIISRYGSEKYHKESGKALAVMCYFQRGTPFIYQGQEIGMLNNHLDSFDEFRDVVTFNNKKIFNKLGFSDEFYLKLANKTSRENARSPMQWDDTEYAGFSKTKPWFKVNENYKTRQINVLAEEKDPDSILNFYRKIFKIRQSNPLFIYGNYKEFMKNSKIFFCYERSYNGKRALVIVSFSDKNKFFKLPIEYSLLKGKLLISNYKDAPFGKTGFELRPYEARVYLY